MSKFYITTPIYYINDKPHIGHAYVSLLADVLARFHRQHNDEVWFLTGTDENSQKTVQSAEKAQLDLKTYSDQMSSTWQTVLKSVGISYDRFIRTTESDHAKAVHDFIKRVDKKGDIYKGEYEGLYCVGCEEFKREDGIALSLNFTRTGNGSDLSLVVKSSLLVLII